MFTIVPVVEGDGEISAFPLLLRRLLYEKYGENSVVVGQPVNAGGRTKLLSELEKFIGHAKRKPGCGAILILLDSDDNCPRELASALKVRCCQAAVGKPIAIVCATRAYEAWFLASWETIRGNAGISDTSYFTGNAEEVGDIKGWLTQQMPPGRIYKPTLNQASLTSHIDMEQAITNSRSFRRLCHAVEQLVGAMKAGNVMTTP